MNLWKELLVETQRRNWEASQAESDRFMRVVDGLRISNGHLHRRWLMTLGQRLEIWGRHLQSRYSTVALAGNGSMSTEPGARPCT